MATFTVDNLIDENDGNVSAGNQSLREALILANDDPAADTIVFGPSLAGGTIWLSQALGELVIASDVTIDGDINDNGAPDITITGDTAGDDATTTDPLGNTITDAINNDVPNRSDNVRVFNVIDGFSTIDGLVITGGFVSDAVGGEYTGGGVNVAAGAALMVTNSSVSGNDSFYGRGGGIFNGGTATLTNTTVSGNDAGGGYGAGIFNDGTATLTNTTVSGNDAGTESGRGGGIFNGGTATLTDTTVSGNDAGGSGGIFNDGTATLTNTTVSGNLAEDGIGGGIRNDGTATLTNTTVSGNFARWFGGGFSNNNGAATLTNTTVSGNTASDGGGIDIFSGGTLTLTNTTVSGNTAFDGIGGGISNDNNGTATLALANTIVLGNSAPTDPEIIGGYTGSGPNIIGGTAGDVFAAIDPVTGGGLLADNGGAVQTIALKNDAPNLALDAGQDDRLDESVVGLDLNGDGDTADVIDTDARGSGFTRFIDLPGIANNGANTVDIGAFEVQDDDLTRVSETDVNSFFSLRDQFFASDGVIIEANLRDDGVDRDFFEVSDLPAGAFLEVEVVDEGLNTVLGRFDAHGNVIEIDDNSGQGLLSRLTSIVPDDGVVTLAVSGFADFDFDGKDDDSGRPHGESGDYELVVHPTILPTVAETDINSHFRYRDQFSAPEGVIIEANLRDDGFDRDYFEISDLAPGSRFQAEVVDTGLDTVLGLFDAHGNVIETDDNSGQGSLSRLTGIVPDDGVLNLAVSGYPDFDFDGRDDRSGYPHGESGDYDLVLIV